jgi:hypothetical protein
VSCISQFTISDYYKIPSSPDFQNNEIEQVSERKKEERPTFLSLFSLSLPRRKQNKYKDDEDITDITMNEVSNDSYNLILFLDHR